MEQLLLPWLFHPQVFFAQFRVLSPLGQTEQSLATNIFEIMWLPRSSNLPSPAGLAMPASGEWIQGKEGGTIPAHNIDISKFRHCKPIRFYLFKSEHPSPAPQRGSDHLSSLGKARSTCCAMSSPTVCFKNTHWCLLPPRWELYLHHRLSTLTRLSYNAEHPFHKHSLGPQNFCAILLDDVSEPNKALCSAQPYPLQSCG